MNKIRNMNVFLNYICIKIENFILNLSKFISWIIVLLLFLIVFQVLLRYVFSINYIWIEELQWHLFGAIFMFGVSYSLVNDTHVRVDLLRVKMSKRLRSKIEIIGILFLLLPFIFIVIDYGYDLAFESYRVGEKSDNPGGLPYRWLIKSVIPISFLVLLFASLLRLVREFKSLFNVKEKK